jgi:hypothetical protein
MISQRHVNVGLIKIMQEKIIKVQYLVFSTVQIKPMTGNARILSVWE